MAALTNHHRVRDVGAELEVVFNVAGRDVLAARGDDDVLEPVLDAQEAIGIDGAAVAGVQPAISVDGLPRLLGQFPVASENIGPAHQHLVIGAEPDFGALCAHPGGADADAVGRHRGAEAAGLGHAKSFQQVNADGHVPAQQVGRHGGGAGHGGLDVLQPEKAAQIGQHQLLLPGVAGGAPAGDGPAIEPGLRHGRALGQHLGIDFARHGQGILHVQGDLGVHFFPEPGRAEDHMGRNLTHVVEDGAGVLRKMHGLTLRQWVVGGAHALGDVAQRQKRQGPVQRLQLQVLLHAVDLKHQVAVADHGPFRCAGGARGVDQERNVLGPAGVDGRVKALRVGRGQRLALRQELIKRGGHRVRQVAQAFQVGDDDALQRRAVAAHGQHLVVLLLVFHKQHAHPGVLKDVLHLFWRRGGVDARAQNAHALRTEVGVQPFGPVFGQDGDRLAALQAQAVQRHADGTGPLKVLRPAGRGPDAFFLVAQCSLRRPVPAAGAEQFLGRVLAVSLDGRG